MDGTTLDCIIIPIVVVISLAAWLFMVLWADAHPGKGVSRPPVATVEPASGAVTLPRQAAAPVAEADLVVAR